MQYNKLVRDKIPEIISQKGEQSTWHVADNEEYELKLHEKLREEVDEFLKNEDEDKIADILEVLDAIIAHHEFSKEDIMMAKDFKKAKRGGFEKRIILEES